MNITERQIIFTVYSLSEEIGWRSHWKGSLPDPGVEKAGRLCDWEGPCNGLAAPSKGKEGAYAAGWQHLQISGFVKQLLHWIALAQLPPPFPWPSMRCSPQNNSSFLQTRRNSSNWGECSSTVFLPQMSQQVIEKSSSWRLDVEFSKWPQKFLP